MPTLHRISPCLWFDGQAEPAAQLYMRLFPSAKIVSVARYGSAGTEIHGRAPGSVMPVAFEFDSHAFAALNGGPCIQVQRQQAQQCGWLKDRFGVSWQIVPSALLGMKKLDLAKLRAAWDGQNVLPYGNHCLRKITP